MHARQRVTAIVLAVIFLLIVSLPYLFAWQQSDQASVFGGFLLNPLDGNSYLAKMREGYDGAWRFTLPYTADPGPGTFLNVFYLLLGHVASWFNLSLVFVFHFARIAGAGLLCFALYRFFATVFINSSQRLWAYGLALFGSGLGWLGIAFGVFTSNFWVAEAYPFLSSFANAHFPLGLALQIFLLTPLSKDSSLGNWHPFTTVLLAFILSVVYPFGWAVSVAVLTLGLLARTGKLLHWIAVLAGGAPYVFYTLWVVNTHPQLSQWNAQNLTPAPGIVDFLVSFSPALLLALVGCYLAISKKRLEIYPLLVWLIVGIALVYFPSDLQRRFISGLYVPIVGLCVFAVFAVVKEARWAMLVMLLFSVPTNLLILLGGLNAAQARHEDLYIPRSEIAAFEWLAANAKGSLVLAPPETGLLLPAYADVRVLYGHPFETIEAEMQRKTVEDFYSGRLDAVQFLLSEDVDFVFYAPDGKQFSPPNTWKLVFSSGGTEIFGHR